MTGLHLPRTLLAPLLALAVGLGALVGCSGNGATSCGTSGCTVTFSRPGRPR